MDQPMELKLGSKVAFGAGRTRRTGYIVALDVIPIYSFPQGAMLRTEHAPGHVVIAVRYGSGRWYPRSIHRSEITGMVAQAHR